MAGGNALANLAGGIINAVQNRRFMNESYQREDTQLQRMVADAKVAGISPVAALGASGAYSQTANYQPETSGDLIGAGLADAYGERAELENELLRAQISRENAEAAGLVTEARSRTLESRARAAEAETAALAVYDPQANALFNPGGIREPEVGVELAGGPVIQWNGFVPAETAEEIFGEPGEWIQGAYNIGRYAIQAYLQDPIANYGERQLPGQFRSPDIRVYSPNYGWEFSNNARVPGATHPASGYPWSMYNWQWSE